MSVELLAQSVLNGLLIGGVYALFACGATLVYASTKILNFAHGDFMTLALYGALSGMMYFQIQPYVSMLVIIPMLFGIGYLVFRYLLRPLLESYFLLTVQVTLGIMFFIESILVILFKTDPQSVTGIASEVILRLGSLTIWGPLLVGFVVAVIVLTGLFWTLANTDIGRSVRAIVENPLAASLQGINISQIQVYVFAVGVALAGLAGELLAPSMSLTPTAGIRMSLMAFTIMVLGGLGNFMGALIGALIIGVVQSLSAVIIGGPIAAAVPYGIFVLILLVRPQGVLSRA